MICTTILFDILGSAVPDSMRNHLARYKLPPRLSVSYRSDNSLPRVQCGTSRRMMATFGVAMLILNRAYTPPPHFVT
jgi:hypothetical protein